MEGFYYKPRIDRQLLEKHHEGLVAISPLFGGEITLDFGNETLMDQTLDFYKSVFGNDFYLQLTVHPEIDGHEEKIKHVTEISKKYEVPIVASHEVYYISPQDKLSRDTLLAVQNIGEKDRDYSEGGEDFSFISCELAEDYFKSFPEALKNNSEIEKKCNLELKLGSWVFPHFEVPSGSNHDNELKKLVYDGLKRRKLDETDEIKERIEYELSVIAKKGYSPYFLIVADILRFAHENKIITNTRGSVAGSMVSFLCGITTVNPIEYKLPFERFLNPERPSAPDIDIDIADDKRDGVIEYARKKYGEDKVAQIGTFGTMMARGAVRDIARALDFPYSLGDRIAKLIPFGSQGFPMTIDKAFEIVPELKNLYESEKDVRDIIDMAKKIEGCARHISVHAAGVVISPTKLTDFVPLQYDPKGENKVITQYDMYSIEDAGLLKFDLLGLKNLAIIADTIHRLEAIEGKTIDIENIPLDDKKTFEILSRGETEGVFQLNGDGMTRFLIELKPSSIHDINAMVALYRPGPMEVIPEYIRRKNNPKLITFLDPRMEKFLKESYGLIVYQDDLLFCAIDLAGYSWIEADKFRKAVGKKIPAEMAAQKKKFIDGVIENGQSPAFAEKLWKLFEPFQAYGFNKAHAASYGRVSYQTAYLKANYPAIYMSAVLTADSGNIEKIATFINECKRMGIPVLPPSVNESFRGFSVVRADRVPDTIRFGLATIKNFGEGISRSIVEERKQNGKFISLPDFIQRIKDKNLNKKSLESLIKAGALDEFEDRGVMFANLELLLEFHKEQMMGSSSHDSLFGTVGEISSISLKPALIATIKDKLAWERELLGLYISGHPLDNFKDRIEKSGNNILKIRSDPKEGVVVVLAGIVDELREVTTKGNERMMFFKLSDLTGSIEGVAFPRTYEALKEIVKPEACIAIGGKISKRNGEVSIILEKAKVL